LAKHFARWTTAATVTQAVTCHRVVGNGR